MENPTLGATDREELVGCLLGLAKVHYDRLIEGTSRLGLTMPQARVLYFVESDPTVGKLAKKLDCDASYITGLVDSLEKAKLLKRQVDADDRRIKRLVLTAAGRRARQKVAKVIGESFDLDGLVPDEAQQFAQLLRKLQNDERALSW